MVRTLLSAVEQSLVFLVALINLDELCTSEELHNKARSDDGANAKLHQRAAVRSNNHTHPVEGIRRVGRLDAIEGHLRAHQEDEQRQGCPDDLIAESHLQGGHEHAQEQRHATFLPPSGCATSGMIAMKGFTT